MTWFAGRLRRSIIARRLGVAVFGIGLVVASAPAALAVGPAGHVTGAAVPPKPTNTHLTTLKTTDSSVKEAITMAPARVIPNGTAQIFFH